MLGSLCYFSYAAYLFMDVYVNKGVKTKISVQTADQLEVWDTVYIVYNSKYYIVVYTNILHI